LLLLTKTQSVKQTPAVSTKAHQNGNASKGWYGGGGAWLAGSSSFCGQDYSISLFQGAGEQGVPIF